MNLLFLISLLLVLSLYSINEPKILQFERKKRITIIFHKFHRKKNTNMKTLELLPSQGSNGCYILHLAWTGGQKVLREGAGCRYVILSTKSTWLYLLSFLLVL